MSFENYAIQYRELCSDSTQFLQFFEPKFSYRKAVINNNSQDTTGILVVDLKGRMISLNKNFISMWNLSQEIVSLQDDWQAIKLVSTQFENPASFLKEMRKIYDQRDLKIYDSIKLKNGRIFERLTKPQFLGGQIIGRIWIFRQIT
ncbi:hypothetical protein [Myxosarcina sp. GI1(2024)]